MKPLSKSELAWLYSPGMTQVSALNRLARWINGDHLLLHDLQEAGYRPNQRILTARQVAIIFDHLGNPLEESELVDLM